MVLTGIAFWGAHADKVALSHLPFHLAASILLGLAAYLTRSLLPAIIGHGVGDALLLPMYVFREPAFVWNALAARPIWEGRSVTLRGKLELIGQAMAPSALFEPGPGHTLALIGWVFIVGAALTGLAFFGLARATRGSAVPPRRMA